MLIKFRSIIYNNYKAIKKGSLSLDEKGVVLLQGINNDKSGSNGAGKSTIASGLLWCLFDRTLLGKETEKEICSKKKFVPTKEFKATNGCYVAVTFDRGDTSYRVTRHRKHPVHKNTVTVEQMDAGCEYINKTKCTDKETNLYIEDIVGADYHAFVHSNIFSFSNIVPFLMQSDKDKKELILPKYFVEMFKGAYKKCTGEITKVKGELSATDDALLSLSIQESEKGNVRAGLLRDINIREGNREELRDQIDAVKNKKALAMEEIGKWSSDLTRCNKELGKIAEEKAASEKEHAEWTKKSGELVSLSGKRVLIERDISNNKLLLEGLKGANKNGGVARLAELAKEMETRSEEFSALNSRKEGLVQKLAGQREVLEDILSTKKKLTETYDDLQERFQEQNRCVAHLTSEKKSLLEQEESIRTKYYSDECKICPASKMKGFFEENENKVRDINVTLLEEQEEIKNLQEEIKESYDYIQEVVALETESNGNIHKTENGELVNIALSIRDLSLVLIELKDEVVSIQSTVDNADVELNKITLMEQDIKTLESSLVDLNAEFKLKRAENPNAQVDRFKNLINLSEGARSRVQREKEMAQTVLGNAQLSEREFETKRQGLIDNLNAPSDLEERIKDIDYAIVTVQENKGVALFNQDKFKTTLDLLNFWKVGFSPAGIEGFMLDSLLDVMNELIAKYLHHLSSGTIALTLKPDSTLKTGDTRNKISEKVENDFGGETYRGNSNGEKRTMDIALLFALKYIYEEITGTKYNLLFMDEAFDTLDAPTCSLVVTLIHSLENIDSVLVVSHNPDLALEFENIINMVKTNGISEIEE